MKIALVGNQNSGKTTLFNLLTGSNQKIGNWPGVTIERKSGIIKGTESELVDLPGIYSLSPYTLEEEVSRKFIFEANPDLIINIIDCTSIERSLYLTTQLMELHSNVITVLNMVDIMESKGVTIDIEKLAKILRIKIVKISALKKTGIEELIEIIKNFKPFDKNYLKIYNEDIEREIEKLEPIIEENHKRFVAVKILEKDKLFAKYLNAEVLKDIENLETSLEMDMEQAVANERYNFISKVKEESIKIDKKERISDKLDKVVLNKWAGIPIFILIMGLIYFLSVGVVGEYTVSLIDSWIGLFMDWTTKTLVSLNASSWAVSLVVDGIIKGVGAVMNFIPQLLMLFLCISILETSGYMSRIAFILDRLFKKFGLSGKSLIPFIVGSGCSVPGIMTARTVEDEKERRMTVVLTPFIPCSAKLPIIALFAGYFFGSYSGLVSVSLYVFAIVVILLSAIVMKKFFYKGEASTFVSELPDFKFPNPRYVFRDVFDKILAFIKRAGTIIFLCSIIIWVLLSFSWQFEYGVPIERSILAGIGNSLAFLFYPMLGEWSWGATVSAIQGLVAKEQVVSSMSIIAGFGEGASGNLIFESGSVFSFFNGASGYAFMVFNLFSAPCFGAIGAMKKELGSTKRMFLAIGFQTVLAFILSYIVFGVGTLILAIGG